MPGESHIWSLVWRQGPKNFLTLNTKELDSVVHCRGPGWGFPSPTSCVQSWFPDEDPPRLLQPKIPTGTFPSRTDSPTSTDRASTGALTAKTNFPPPLLLGTTFISLVMLNITWLAYLFVISIPIKLYEGRDFPFFAIGIRTKVQGQGHCLIQAHPKHLKEFLTQGRSLKNEWREGPWMEEWRSWEVRWRGSVCPGVLSFRTRLSWALILPLPLFSQIPGFLSPLSEQMSETQLGKFYFWRINGWQKNKRSSMSLPGKSGLEGAQPTAYDNAAEKYEVQS
jgi:hypothetical protein